MLKCSRRANGCEGSTPEVAAGSIADGNFTLPPVLRARLCTATVVRRSDALRPRRAAAGGRIRCRISREDVVRGTMVSVERTER